MKRIHVVGKNSEKIDEIKKELNGNGLEYVEENPEIVISYGGDGTFLIAERRFPGVPKILVRDSEIGNKTHDLSVAAVMELYMGGKYVTEEIPKLKAVRHGSSGRELVGVNDVVIRNSMPTSAVRFDLFIDGKKKGHYIGDGLVISTPYGSEAYFSSVCRRDFSEGLGLAFNNASVETEPLFLTGDEKIEIEITRGPAVLIADNNRDFVHLRKGDRVVVKRIEEVARRIILKNG